MKHGPGCFRLPTEPQKKVSAREARMSSPDNDHSPTWPITLTDAVWKAQRLSDMGIYPVRTIRLIARCSWHGRMTLDVETTELLDSDVLSGYIQCQGFHDGKRWLRVESTQLLPEEKRTSG